MDPDMLRMFKFSHITELCTILKISPMNCSCEKLLMGSTENNRSFCGQPFNLRMQISNDGNHFSIIIPLLVTLVAIIGLLGNTIVVYVYTKIMGPTTKHSALITLLAVCDLSFAILMLLYCIPKLWTSRWLYGDIGCKIIGSGVSVGAWLSIGIILNIAVERFFGIAYPLRRLMTWRTTYVCLIANFCLTLIAVVPRALALNIDEETLDCQEIWPKNRYLDHLSSMTYDWLIFIVYFLTPFLLISSLYFRMFLSISNMQLPGIASEPGIIERARRNRRTVVLLSLVLGAFAVCTFPNKIRWLLLSYKVEGASHPVCFAVTEVMYSVHVSVNPIVYVFADIKFRRIVRGKLRTLIGTILHRSNIGDSCSITIDSLSPVTESFDLHTFTSNDGSLENTTAKK